MVLAIGLLPLMPHRPIQAAGNGVNLIQNGSFETGPHIPPSPKEIVLLLPGNTSIAGWTITEGSIDYVGKYWQSSDGSRSLDLSGFSAGEIRQTFDTTSGLTYRIHFDLAGEPLSTPPPTKQLKVSVIGSGNRVLNAQEFSFDATQGTTLGQMGWVQKSLEFTANSSAATLVFKSQDEGSAGPALDNVKVFVQASNFQTAYQNPAGTFPQFNGSPSGLVVLGLDFDVHRPIKVLRLGAFDYGQDGGFVHELEVGIFDRDTRTLVGPSVRFSTASPGSLVFGSRFKNLDFPIELKPGFHGSIVVSGYSSSMTAIGEPWVDEYNTVPWPQTTNDAGGAISFVSSRGEETSEFKYPSILDTYVYHDGNDSHQYMAGTFDFVVNTASLPRVELGQSVYLKSVDLVVGSEYQTQISTNLLDWSNHGRPFIATEAKWRSEDHFDVDDSQTLYFRLKLLP